MVAHTYVSAVALDGEGFFLLHTRAAQGRGQQQRSSVGVRGGGVPTARPRQQRAKFVRRRELADEVEAQVQDAVPHLQVWPAALAATRPSLFRGGKCPARPVVDRCAGDLDRAGAGAPAVALESSRRSGDLLYPPTWVRPLPFAGGLPVMAGSRIPAMI